MVRAKFISKSYGTGYDRNSIYLEYEYKGMRYTIREDRVKGNEPLAWQHKSEQSMIDRMLESQNKPITPGKPINMKEIFEMLGWD